MRLMWAVAVAPAEVLARAPAGTPGSPEKQIPISSANSYQLSYQQHMAAIRFCRLVVPQMKRRGGGRIINITTIGGGTGTFNVLSGTGCLLLATLFFGQFLAPVVSQRYPDAIPLHLQGEQVHVLFALLYAVAAVAMWLNRPKAISSLRMGFLVAPPPLSVKSLGSERRCATGDLCPSGLCPNARCVYADECGVAPLGGLPASEPRDPSAAPAVEG